MSVTAAKIKEMEKKVEAINLQRAALAEERDYYLKTINKYNLEKRTKGYKKYVGKCYRVEKNPNSSCYQDVKALKVLDWQEGEEVFFKCVIYHSRFDTCSIEINRFPLMGPLINRLGWTPESSELKWIDVCEEISQEEFEKIITEKMEGVL